jgi:hypothetical protein
MGCPFVFPDTDSDVDRRILPVSLPALIVCSTAFIRTTVPWFDIPWFWFSFLEEKHRKLGEDSRMGSVFVLLGDHAKLPVFFRRRGCF